MPARLLLGAWVVLAPGLTWAADVTSGQEVFATRCTKCHGVDGKGNPQVAQILQAEIPDLTSKAVQAKTERELLEIITKGKSRMPAFEWSMEGKDREDVVAYIRTLRQR